MQSCISKITAKDSAKHFINVKDKGKIHVCIKWPKNKNRQLKYFILIFVQISITELKAAMRTCYIRTDVLINTPLMQC